MTTQTITANPIGAYGQRAGTRRPTTRVAPVRRPARRGPQVLGPRTGAVRRSLRPHGVPAPELRRSVAAAALPVAVAPVSDQWRLTDRGLAVVLGAGGLLLALALVMIVTTFFAVTGEVPQAAPFARLG